ncbi:major facilitator superfamily domain-containing protein [Mycena galericulata]|nr:major facilitator superfamily domain-containing protein [Mycena galericulata]
MDMDAEKPTVQQSERVPARFAEDTKHEGGPFQPTYTNTSVGDTEKSSGYAVSTTGIDHRVESIKAERRLLFKLDIVILPLAVLLYLSAYLDRGNLGNARLQGLEATVLRGSDTNYSLALSCFFISYIILSIPGTLLAKAILPSTSIAIGAVIWSIAATCQAAAFSPAALYVCRIFVGVGESMFSQSMALYFTYWYLPNELSKRIGLFISAGSVAGAFGGLISYGVSSLKHPAITQWRILFLIEGIPSFIVALAVFFFLPSRPQTSRYISEEERTLALTRLNRKNLGEGHTGIDWRAVRRAFADWKTYVVAVIYSCMNLGLGSVGGFLPTIIKGLGYSNAQAQLYTVPPYVVSLVFMLLIASYSDHYQTRGIPVVSVFSISIIGWGILLGVSPIHPSAMGLHARYFGCICIVTSGYANIPLIMSWQSGNTGSQSQRAVSLGMLNAIGQCLSVLAAFLFPSSEGPRYVKGCATNIAFSCLGLILTAAMTVFYRVENKRRDEVEGGRPPKDMALNVVEEYDLARGFRYTP